MPLRFLGIVDVGRLPMARLDNLQAAERLALERDLRQAPTPISGGMRKALAKETAIQDALRHRSPRRYREADMRRAYGLMLAQCNHCSHAMYFDEIEPDAYDTVRCDRCKRPICG